MHHTALLTRNGFVAVGRLGRLGRPTPTVVNVPLHGRRTRGRRVVRTLQRAKGGGDHTTRLLNVSHGALCGGLGLCGVSSWEI